MDGNISVLHSLKDLILYVIFTKQRFAEEIIVIILFVSHKFRSFTPKSPLLEPFLNLVSAWRPVQEINKMIIINITN